MAATQAGRFLRPEIVSRLLSIALKAGGTKELGVELGEVVWGPARCGGSHLCAHRVHQDVGQPGKVLPPGDAEAFSWGGR